MQIAAAFGRVQDSLSYFVDMYASIAQWQAVVDRLTGFGLHMAGMKAENPQINLNRITTESNKLKVRHMNLELPNGDVLLRDISFALEAGNNVLVKGTSGSGKSTLLRAIAGIWPYVNGEIELPEKEKIMFVPQKPYLPLGTLREALLYPGTREKTDEELVTLMEDCHIGYLAGKLYMEADWSHVLSVGEQQRLAFVRTLIYEPAWLFLDEATSALDEETEAKVYTLLAERLPETTVVSVGHRSTLNQFHAIEFNLDKRAGSVILQSMQS